MNIEIEQYKQVYETFFHPWECVEIRAIGLSGRNRAWSGFCKTQIVSGYYDNALDFAQAAAMLDSVSPEPPAGIYYTANPARPELLARASRRLVASPAHSTQDHNILCLRWLLIDMDP